MYNKAYEFADKHGVRLIEQPFLGGVRLRMMFSNGYGVSIVMNEYSYGGNDGKYELAVLEGSEENYQLCYDTDITDDVIGWLDLEEALDIADRVSKLTNRVSKLTKDGKEKKSAVPVGSFMGVMVYDHDDAKNIVNELKNRIEKYGETTKADLLELVKLPCTHTDYNFGWTDPNDIGIRKVPTGYLIGTDAEYLEQTM